MKNNKIIKDAFMDIKVDKKLDTKILDSTINKNSINKKYFKLAQTLSLIVFACLISLSVVYADEIKEFIDSFKAVVKLEDGTELNITDNMGFKEINNTDLITSGKRIQTTYEKLEHMLGFSILKIQDRITDEIYYDVGLNDDKTIGRIDLWIPSPKENISVYASMLNKDSDLGYIIPFTEGIDAIGNKVIKDTLKSSKLNIDIVLYGVKDDKKRLVATFVYDDIYYEFIGEGISQNKMLNIIEDLYY